MWLFWKDERGFWVLNMILQDLTPITLLWDELREKYFHNQAFDSMDALEVQLLKGLSQLEKSPQAVKSIAGWEWILNLVSNAN